MHTCFVKTWKNSFQKQIEKGGPITVTHAEMTRYFMTPTEAAQLVIQASFMSKSGEVFLLDMGEPVKILDKDKPNHRRRIFLKITD